MSLKVFHIAHIWAFMLRVANVSQNISIFDTNRNINSPNYSYYNSFIYVKKLYGPEDIKKLSKRSLGNFRPQRRLDVSSSIWSDVTHKYSIRNSDRRHNQEFDKVRDRDEISDSKMLSTQMKKNHKIKYNSMHKHKKLQRKSDDGFTYFESAFDVLSPEKFTSYNEIDDTYDKFSLRKSTLQRYTNKNSNRSPSRHESFQATLDKYYYDDPIDDELEGEYDYYEDSYDDVYNDNRPNLKGKFKGNKKYRGTQIFKHHNSMTTNRYEEVETVGQDNIDRYVGPLISSHVVTTSIHPWVFPFFYQIAEPYISFITFLITALIELFGLGVGSGFVLVGLRSTRDNGNNDNGISGSSSSSSSQAAAIGTQSYITYNNSISSILFDINLYMAF